MRTIQVERLCYNHFTYSEISIDHNHSAQLHDSYEYEILISSRQTQQCINKQFSTICSCIQNLKQRWKTRYIKEIDKILLAFSCDKTLYISMEVATYGVISGWFLRLCMYNKSRWYLWHISWVLCSTATSDCTTFHSSSHRRMPYWKSKYKLMMLQEERFLNKNCAKNSYNTKVTKITAIRWSLEDRCIRPTLEAPDSPKKVSGQDAVCQDASMKTKGHTSITESLTPVHGRQAIVINQQN